MSVRLAWPMSLAAGSLATVEQDSDEDIVQCAKAILMHRPGDRADIPEMGVPDFTFEEEPLNLSVAQEVLRRHEPRVDFLVTEESIGLEQLVAEVRVEMSRKGVAGA